MRDRGDLPLRQPELLAAGPAGRPGTGLAAHAADAARPAEPRPTRRRASRPTTRTASKILDTYKQIGTVIEAFRLNHQAKYDSIMQEYAGRAAIGHVRYATCGANDRSYAQPFERHHGCKWKWFSFAFNGQLANFAELRDELLTLADYHLTRETDTEVIMHYLSHELRGDERPDLVEVFRNLSQKFDGAYNIVFLNAHGRHGRRCATRRAFGRCATRRTARCSPPPARACRCSNLGFRDIHSLEPGEMIVIQDNQVPHGALRRRGRRRRTASSSGSTSPTSPARSTSAASTCRARPWARSWRGRSASSDRVPLDDDTIVVPVPDTGKAAADAMAYELGVPSVEGLMRNRYVGRTFIEGENRADRVRLKYTPLREVLEGKRVLLIEDTIVRSTTLKSLLHHIRERGGAREIHVRVACPPIVAPCFYGIDMSTVRELFAPRFMKGSRPTRGRAGSDGRRTGRRQPVLPAARSRRPLHRPAAPTTCAGPA